MRTSSNVRVRYAETDQMGVAHHSSYVAWLELARVDWLTEAGLEYAELERGGLFFPVVELRIRYKRPARFNETLAVETWLERLASRRFEMGYRITRDGVIVAEAATVHIPQDASGRARRLPQDVMDLLQRNADRET